MWNQLLKFVIKNADNDIIDKHQLNALLNMCSCYETSSTGCNILHFASIGESEVLLKILLQETAKELVHLANYDGEMPLHWACQRDNIKILELLLCVGVDMDATDINGDTALHWAVNASSYKVVEYLLEFKHVYSQRKNNEGLFPLDIAVNNGDDKMIDVFLKSNLYSK